MKKLIPVIFAIMIVLVLASCGKSRVAQSNIPSASPIPPEVTLPEPSPSSAKYTNPLTGEPLEKDISAERPYAVMLNDISVALPQCGISKADILYEVLAEGNITRFEAIFTDLNGVGNLGSIRSARPYYLELALSYDAIFVHAGGSEQAYSDISSKNVNNIDGVRGAYSSQIFYRDPTRQKFGTEHSLFATSDKILQYTGTLGYSSQHSTKFDYGLHFTDKVDLDTGASASNINVSFGGLKSTSFSYDSGTGFYTARQYNKDLIDGTTNENVQFKNILVLYDDTKILDDYGRRSVDLNGSGTGIFACNGKSVPIKWSHVGTGKSFTYTLEDGSALNLGIGKTYIGIVPTGSDITLK